MWTCWGGTHGTTGYVPGPCPVRAAACCPNDLGLFDVLGNAYAQCQDRLLPYRPDRAGVIVDDINTHDYVYSTERLLRGGAFLYRPGFVRAADRYRSLSRRTATPPMGFRPSRTYD